MKLKPKTPRTEMAYASLVEKALEIFEPVSEVLGLPSAAVDGELSKFLLLSTRIEPGPHDKLDFEFAAPGDGPDVIQKKFLKYCDTRHYPELLALLDDGSQQNTQPATAGSKGA